MVNIAQFWHDHNGIRTKKSIQSSLKLLKEKKSN